MTKKLNINISDIEEFSIPLHLKYSINNEKSIKYNLYIEINLLLLYLHDNHLNLT
jgi:hypothetical protein